MENEKPKQQPLTPLDGKSYAEKVKIAMNQKNLLSPSGFKSMQSVFVEQARLMSWLWGGACLVGLVAYGIGRYNKRETNN